MSKRIFSYKNTFINSIGTLLSRVTGIFKMNVVNHLFGMQADLFWAAYRIPNNLRRIVGEGAMTNAFIPIYKSRLETDKAKAEYFANNIINIFFLGTLLLTFIGIIFAPLYFPLFVPGFKNSTGLNQAVILTMIMMPFTIMISLYSTAMGILNSHKKFLSSSLAPLLFNIIFVIFPLVFVRKWGIYSLGWGVVVGGLCMFLLEVIELRHTNFIYRFAIDFKDPLLKDFIQLFLPATGNMFLLQLNSIITLLFMSFIPGSMVVINNAFIINQAPIGMVGVAIGTVILPLMSGLNLSENSDKMQKILQESFYLLFYLILPISLFFVVFSDTLVNLAYRDLVKMITGNTGKYTKELLSLTAYATAFYGFSLIPSSMNIVLIRIFYALKDAKTPFINNLIILIVSTLIYTLGYVFKMGISSILFADVIAVWIIILYMNYQLKNKIKLKWLEFSFIKKIGILFFISLFCLLPVYGVHYFYQKIEIPLLSLFVGSMELAIFSFLYYYITKKAGLSIKR